MRIAHLNDVAYVAYNYAEAQRKLGHTAEVLTLDVPGASLSTARKLAFIPQRLASILRANARIRAGKFDVVHIHFGYFGLAGIIGRYPYFLHLHGTDIRHVRQDPLRWPITRAAVAGAIRPFYVTPDLQAPLEAIRRDGIFLPNPLYTERFTPQHKHWSDPPRVLCFTRLFDRVKGSDIMFAGVNLLRQQGYRFHFSVLDYGPDRARYYDFPATNFLPVIPRQLDPKANQSHDKKIAALINSHDIVLGQFVRGVLGLAELEAISCANPLIANFQPTPLYSEQPPMRSAQTPEAVAAQLAHLLDHPTQSQELGLAARAWVIKYHGQENAVRRLMVAYQR
jgi:glycosyltransferase involved in cell wall biosynthesis